MTEPLAVQLLVQSKANLRARETDADVVIAGWVVVGLFAPTDVGEPTCIDYRVRAIANTRALDEWQSLADAMAASMHGLAADMPIMRPLPGGVPRYVFEEASQTRLLAMARERLAQSDVVRSSLTSEALALVASGQRRKPGRPPQGSLKQKLLVLEAVEAATLDATPHAELAKKFALSRSALRDLLSWARHDADPRLFTTLGPGRRGGALTPEARQLLAQIRAAEQ